MSGQWSDSDIWITIGANARGGAVIDFPTLFGAPGACASAQATMNNRLVGDACRQYEEFICGGSGAGSGFDGATPVQTQMTDDGMTDPEVLEPRRLVAGRR